MIQVPEKLKDFNLVMIGSNGKHPVEKGWQKKVHRFNDPLFQTHILSGKNYGVQSNNSCVVINGETYFLIIVDFDKKEFMDNLLDKFPETFTTTSGSPKQCYHLWFASDNNKAFKIKDEKLNTLADVIGAGNQVIAPGSKHPCGSIYSIVKDIPIVFMNYAEIEAILKPHDKTPKKAEKPQKQYVPNGVSGDVSQKILDSISMEEVLNEVGIDTSKNPTNCCFHSSVGGKCLGFNNETIHCFHCDFKGNKYSLIREVKKLSDKETFEWLAEKAGMMEELKKNRKEYASKSKPIIQDGDIFSRRAQIEAFWKIQPFFYDASKIFWLWNNEEKKWVLSDEVDYLNNIQEKLGVETIDSKARIELVEGFKQIGRKHKPKEIKHSWVQFKDKIYDVKKDEVFEATPEYFVTNPIPWNVGKDEDTPTIDRLFREWVGEEYKQTLYEIMAYNISLNKFMQRIIGLCGGGSNGKGTFIKLNYKFLGQENCVSSEIKSLSEDKFEPAVLYRKLLCVMGEVSYDDLRNTNQLKKLGGEDKISFQFKGKTPFTDNNTATCICLTNAMPITPDKSTGFYRKWMLVDFPNQFKEIKGNLIEQIPEIEFENLAKKCLRILKELYSNPSFTKEGDFEERAKRYEERSNPVMRYIEEFCEESPGENITLRHFTNLCNNYLKTKHLRVMTANQIGKVLRDEGFSVGSRKIEDISHIVILNLGVKTIRTIQNHQIPESFPHVEPIRDLDSFDSSNGNPVNIIEDLVVINEKIEGNKK